VGKTALLTQYVHKDFAMEYKCTIGVAFENKTVQLDDYSLTLQIWDTGTIAVDVREYT
jgi:GTPase SAR1 family protein